MFHHWMSVDNNSYILKLCLSSLSELYYSVFNIDSVRHLLVKAIDSKITRHFFILFQATFPFILLILLVILMKNRMQHGLDSKWILCI